MKHIFKTTLITVSILFLFTSKIFATGAGIQAGLIPGLFINETSSSSVKNLTGNITGTIRMSKFPVVAGAGFEGGKLFSDFNYGFSVFADYWAVDLQIKNTWSFYSGFGFSGKLLTSDFKKWNFAAGARFFAGTNYTFYDNFLELYIQATSNIFVIPGNTFKKTGDFVLGDVGIRVPAEMGIRFHF